MVRSRAVRAWLQRLLEEADARQLPALIAEWGERSDALRWVAIALQLDLPLLIERPELVMPCLVRRCGVFDHEEAYGNRVIPPDATEVRELVEMWLADWEPDGPWLQAVRPPRYPLEVGIVEEYRTSLAGQLRFSDDDALIGIVSGDGDVVAWERATGRRVDARGKLALPVRRWTHEWGARELVAGDRVVPFTVREDDRPRSIVEVAEELVIVNCVDSDNPYEARRSHYLIDTELGRVVWRAYGDCLRARRVGDRIYSTSSYGVFIHELATGVEVATPALWALDGVFSSEGLLAAYEGGVIRVWDLARLPTGMPHVRIGGEVRLSPDETRAMVGDTLIDPRTGQPIAELSFTGSHRGEWLEGGPPDNCFELMNEHAVEVMARGTQIWRTDTGERVGDLFELRAGADDAVCYDPHGRYFAIYRARDQTVSLYDLPAGTSRWTGPAAIEHAGSYTWRFDEDGEVLWWRDTAGAGWALDVGDPRAPERWDGEAPERHEPQRLACRDGVLEVGEAAAPVDGDEVVVTDNGKSFVGATDHYRLRERLGRGGVP